MAFRNLVPGWNQKRGLRASGGCEVPLYSVEREMNRLFDDFFRGWGLGIAPLWDLDKAGTTCGPRIDVTDNDKEIRVAVELPGVDEKDVEVSLSGDVLSIQGEKKAEQKDQGKDYYRLERSYGAFHRSIQLRAKVDEERVEASFKKGVLTIKLPKTAQAQSQSKKIEVKGE